MPQVIACKFIISPKGKRLRAKILYFSSSQLFVWLPIKTTKTGIESFLYTLKLSFFRTMLICKSLY